MLKNNFLRALPVVLMVAAIAFTPVGFARAANVSANSLTLVSPMRQDTEPVTLYSAGGLVPEWDPQKASDTISIAALENMFLGLTDADPQTNQIRPEMATEWSVNDTGDVWTFKLRNDVPWVRWDPATKTATEVRKVTAQDFEYGIKRSCDPRLGAYYSSVSAAMIKGCDTVFKTEADKVTDDLFNEVAVKALDDTTLEITTQGALGYFESVSGMWMLRAVPKETIDEFGDEWVKPGNLVTNGPFVLDELDPNVNRVFLKNPLYVEVNDNYGGNLERVSTVVIEDANTIFSLYLNNQLDTTGVPRAELDRVRADETLSKELRQFSDLAVFYFGFAFDKAPFDKVEARRAFSAAIDRDRFVAEIRGGRGIPMIHFMPPGIRGAVAINEVGVGTNADWAKEQLAAAGYPNCEGLPDISIVTYQGAEQWAEALQADVQNVLGCDPAKITIEGLEFSVLLKAYNKDVPTEQRPHMWTAGWGPDYPDAHNWVHDVLSCNADNPFKRECSAIDEKIDTAARETDGVKRDQMYREIEDEFFGENGLFPIAPLFLRVDFTMVKPWYTGFFDTDGLFGGPHWNTRKIDQAAQLAARGGANVPVVVPTPVPTEVPPAETPAATAEAPAATMEATAEMTATAAQ